MIRYRSTTAASRRLCQGICLALVIAVAGCSAGAKQGASSGAKSGAVGGLVAGAVGSIFWGGDAMNNALRSAAVGAASGAAVGAVSGAEREKRSASTPVAGKSAPAVAGAANPELSQANKTLKAQIGDLNFAAGEELAHCRHVTAISRAEKAFASETDPRRRNYALLIEAMAAEESGNSSKADAVYARWTSIDPAHPSAVSARNAALEGLLKVQKIRQEQGLPVLCT
ncbi:MAG: hypothetical protein R3F24_01330 [Gammaproteobacteria bacterium]